MAHIFRHVVYADRTIKLFATQPMNKGEKGINNLQFVIPKRMYNLPVYQWVWWFVYVNAKNQEFTVPLVLSDYADDPNNYCVAQFDVDFGITLESGWIKFSLEAVDADSQGVINHRWRSNIYRSYIGDTLEGNQIEYDETESDIISALIQQVQNKVNSLVGGATPLPVQYKSQMVDHDSVYLYVGTEQNEYTGYWYYWNGSDFVHGGLYASGITVDAVPTQGSNNAVSSGGVYEALAEVDNSVNTIKSSLGSIDITWVDGFYIKETGEEKSYSIYSCTDYIPLYGEKIYLKTRVHQNATYLAVAFYDSEKTFISGVYNESANTQIFDGEVNIPENAVYARCSSWTSYIESFVFNLYDFINDAIKKLSAVAELPEITADVAQNTADIARNASDIAQNTADIGYLSDRLDGAENICAFTKIAGLQFLDGATNYHASSSYDTWYTPVTGGRHYHFAYTRGTKNVALRMAFAEQIPANQIPATQIGEQTSVTSGTFTLDFVPSANGYFSATAYKNDIETGTMSMTEEIAGIIPMISDVAKEAEQTRINGLKIAGKRNLYFAQESLEQNGTQVRMVSKTVIPHDDAEIYIICPNDICVWFELQKTPYDTTTVTTDYAGNGDSVKLSGGELYKAHFAYAEKTDGQYILTGETLLLADFVTLVESGKVLMLYQEESVIVNNKDSEKKLRALMGSGNAILSHTSDTHGDAIRYANFMEMSRHLGVTCAVNSGDAVNNNVGDGYTYLLTTIAKYPDVSTIFCIGNHDASRLNSTQYERFYKPFDDAYDYEMAQSNVYYYKDYADYNLRVISLDIYEERHNGSNCCISSTQINWLISTLASTPANYGVVIVAHASENFVGKVTGYDKFYSDGITDDWTNRYASIIGNPVSKIVDAFISRTTVSDSYEQTVLTEASGSTTTVETVTYSADFSNVPVTAEFIAYLNGHKHKDMIGYLNGTTNKQLTLNVTHGCTSAYYANQDDFPRADGKGSVQDAFNVYAIDRTNKNVKIFRIGSNVKYDMTMRDYMIIPYAD